VVGVGSTGDALGIGISQSLQAADDQDVLVALEAAHLREVDDLARRERAAGLALVGRCRLTLSNPR
jgi:hypothetical protein